MSDLQLDMYGANVLQVVFIILVKCLKYANVLYRVGFRIKEIYHAIMPGMRWSIGVTVVFAVSIM